MKVKSSCGSQGCNIPSHEKILPKGVATKPDGTKTTRYAGSKW